MPSVSYPGNNLVIAQQEFLDARQSTIEKYSNFLYYFNLAFKNFLGPAPQIQSFISDNILLNDGSDWKLNFTLNIFIENKSRWYKYEILCNATSLNESYNKYKINFGGQDYHEFEVADCIHFDENTPCFISLYDQIKNQFTNENPIKFEISNPEHRY